MLEAVDRILINPYLETVALFMVAILALIVFLTVFEWVTGYKDWEEIKKGNVAVAMALCGKLFGICNIFRFSIMANDSIYQSLILSLIGFLLLLAAYFIFEFLTPFFKIDVEIERDNRAVGLISMVLSISISYVIGASIT